LSHDEVVYGKGALLEKMPGDPWQQRASLRLLLGCMWTHPGKKLLFMGGEFGQRREWNHDAELDWALLSDAEHRSIRSWVTDLNLLYRREPSLYRHDFDRSGFEWIDNADSHNSVVSFLRHAGDDMLLVVCNFTPVVRRHYRVGVPRGGQWRELLNSDSQLYGGSNVGNFGGIEATGEGCHSRSNSVVLTLPPLAIMVFKAEVADRTS
jgi:1,4-alpha-glucan branching enzyme